MAFIEENKDGLIYMRSEIIPLRHAFTTRYGGVSTGEWATLNLGSNRGDDPAAVRENYRRVAALFGAGIDDCCVTRQVHGTEVRVVTEKDRHVCLSAVPYEADGLVTNVSHQLKRNSAARTNAVNAPAPSMCTPAHGTSTQTDVPPTAISSPVCTTGSPANPRSATAVTVATERRGSPRKRSSIIIVGSPMKASPR